jgi:hypothetical protein
MRQKNRLQNARKEESMGQLQGEVGAVGVPSGVVAETAVIDEVVPDGLERYACRPVDTGAQLLPHVQPTRVKVGQRSDYGSV